MSKFKKIDREFQLTDDSTNCYGFRLLTEGYQLAEFQKNPIGYYMHKRDEGVVLKWEDFRTEGNKVYAKPVVNLSHPRGEQTVAEIENGFLNAASVGKLVALEISTDPKDKLPNQKGPTVKKWYNRECSLVDIPGNYNSLAQLYDKDDNEINLADYTEQDFNPNQNEVDKHTLTAAQLSAMNLKADASEMEVSTAFQDLVDKANRTEKAEKELEDLKAETSKKEVEAILKQGLADKRFTKEVADKLEKQFAGRPADLKDLVDAMPKYKSVVGELEGEGKTELENLMAKSYDDLFKSGELEKLKDLSQESFELKRAEKYPNK